MSDLSRCAEEFIGSAVITVAGRLFGRPLPRPIDDFGWARAIKRCIVPGRRYGTLPTFGNHSATTGDYNEIAQMALEGGARAIKTM